MGRPWKTPKTCQALAKPLAMDPALTLESAVTKATKARVMVPYGTISQHFVFFMAILCYFILLVPNLHSNLHSNLHGNLAISIARLSTPMGLETQREPTRELQRSLAFQSGESRFGAVAGRPKSRVFTGVSMFLQRPVPSGKLT